VFKRLSEPRELRELTLVSAVKSLQTAGNNNFNKITEDKVVSFQKTTHLEK
jgi:hypothetical protein